MKILFILLFSILSLYGDFIYFKQPPPCSSVIDSSYLVQYEDGTYRKFTARINTVYEVSDGGFNISSDLIYLSGNTFYCFIDSGLDGGIDDERYYTDYTISSVPTCEDGFTYDLESNSCIESLPTCASDETLTSDNICVKSYLFLDIPESDCIAGTSFTDYSKGLTGFLSWDILQNKCLIVEDSVLPCSSYTELVVKEVFNCDTDLNNFSFSCVDNPGTLPAIETSCTPKNQASTGSPCTEARKQKAKDCADAGLYFDENSICQDNGIVITKDELSCNGVIKPKCDDVWGEVYNPTTNECDCKEGYYKNRFGGCSYDFWGLDDENLTDEQKVQKASAEVSDKIARDASESQADLNQSLSSQTSAIVSLGDGLSGLRSDINTTNNILNDFKDMFDDDEKIDVPETDSIDIDDAKNFLDSVTSQYSDFYDNVKTQINQIEDKYNEALALFNGQRPVYSMPVGSTDNCFSFEVFGRTISLDLCTSLGYFAPIVYFILNIYFMILIFFFSLKYTLRSFQ